ncbi:MAG: hypothetical protein AAGI37_20460 [Planctomycetota bacterium]
MVKRLLKLRARTSHGGLYLIASGLLLCLGGIAHVAVWMADGGSWAGDVSWRKPILFGISTGMTFVSLGWVLTLIRPGSRSRRWVWELAVAIAGLVEVGLITLQAWRGVPSHFNHATPLDTAIVYGIDGLVVVIAVAVLGITVRSFGSLRIAEQPVAADVAWSVRAGLVFLLLSCGFGFWMLWYGESRVDNGQDPGTFGAAGVVKFVHGMPIHALQVLPIAGYVLGRLAVSVKHRLAAVQWLTAAIAVLTVFSAWQTFGGRGRADLEWVGLLLLGAAGACSLAAVSAGWPRTLAKAHPAGQRA